MRINLIPSVGVLAPMLPLLVVIGAPVAGEQSLPKASGSFLYRVYCQNCHGESGRGDGPMARLLKVPAADLTLLRSHHGGDFPTEAVHRAIDGREAVEGHGSREMPLWGPVFQRMYGNTQDPEERVEDRIIALTEYLRSLQRPEEKLPPAAPRENPP
jgi:mono/diheme cytochrome c family protein